MDIKSTQFIGSFNSYNELPEAKYPEVCFIGRSNVGKSSLINYLMDHSHLAKVSSTPGKTQSLNYFLINNSWYLVDLPGYGYARRSKKLRNQWEQLMYQYFQNRDNLDNIFVLVDSRIKPQKIDIDLINWLGEKGIPFAIVFTKADKREWKQCEENIEAFNQVMLESWEELPIEFVTSSTEKKGKKEILNYIASFIDPIE